jgi:hypothetical protein
VGLCHIFLRLEREAADLMQEIMTVKLAAEIMLRRLKIEVSCGYTASVLVSGIGQSI